MPVTKSAKRAQRIAQRRANENVRTRSAYKRTVKAARKALETGTEGAANLLSKAQSALDRAAKNNTIHRNKAARLKSRLAKKMAGGSVAAAKPTAAKRSKKAAPKKTAKKK